MTNKLIRKIEFDDGGPSMEDMGFDSQDFLHHENEVYERIEYADGLIVFRDKTGRWNYNIQNLSTTELLCELENQKWKLKI